MSGHEKNYPLVGILGGMGPSATADFYQKIIAATPAQRDQDHIPVLIHAAPQIPDRSTSLLLGGASPAPALIYGAQKLQDSGAQLLVMPCNTAHYWINEIQQTISIPILHIVDCVMATIMEIPNQPKNIGLLGTAATIHVGLYQNHAQSTRLKKMHWVVPTHEEITSLVTPGIENIKAGQFSNGKILLEAATDQLISRGAELIVLACTEIPLVLHQHPKVLYLDATLSLATAVVAWAMQHKSEPLEAHP